MRTGVFGGTFDPIHLGHLLVADDVRRRLKLDRVLFVPTFNPPRRAATGAPYADRREMVRRAIRNWPGLEFCGVEEKRAGPSYTVDTLETLRSTRKDDALWLIVGADQYRSMATWHRPDQLTRLARIAVMDRPGVARPKPYRSHNPRRVRFVPVMPVDISAAGVRERLAKRKSVRYMLSSVTSEYVKAKRLYRSQ